MVSAYLLKIREIMILNSLNPYYTGRWFLLIGVHHLCGVTLHNADVSLNPYYTGRWFLLWCSYK